MKKVILFLLITGTVTANAQSLKDALYGGKLKTDSNSVIRKGDDLSAKIDTAQKKTEPEKPKAAAASVESGKKVTLTDLDTAIGIKDSAATASIEAKENNAAAKTNTKIWKEYIDSLSSALKTEVLPSKKIKKDTYYLYLDYEIGTDGQVNITNVTSTPEN